METADGGELLLDPAGSPALFVFKTISDQFGKNSYFKVISGDITEGMSVVNARTGSIVMNQAVALGPCAVAHGNLSVTISTTPSVSQPSPLSQGQTVVTEKADIRINQEPGALIQLPAGTKLTDVVKALNTLGANPQDLLAILQAMKAAGALQAELEVI